MESNFSECNWEWPGDEVAYVSLYNNTVKPLIVDPLRKGHNIKDLSTRDTAHGPKNTFSIH